MRDKAPPDERTETADWDTSLGAPCVLIRLTVRAQTCDEMTPTPLPGLLMVCDKSFDNVTECELGGGLHCVSVTGLTGSEVFVTKQE